MNVFIDRMNELKGSMNVSAFARRANIPQPSMDKYLKGRLPSIEILESLCCRFGVSADWLLGLSDDRRGGTPAGDDAAIRDLQKRLHDLEVENAALQKALSLIGGRRVPCVKTGGSHALKTA